MKTKILLS